MANIVITYDGRNTVQSIQAQFRRQLSEWEILRTTARAINETASKVQGHIRANIRREYTTRGEYLKKMSNTSKRASHVKGDTFAEISFKQDTIPMMGFKHTGSVKSKRNVTVTVKKGSTKVLKTAFIAKMKSEHVGIFARGRYERDKFVSSKQMTNTGKIAITEMKAPSPIGMAFTPTMRVNITAYIDRSLPSRLQYFLQQKVDRMAR